MVYGYFLLILSMVNTNGEWLIPMVYGYYLLILSMGNTYG